MLGLLEVGIYTVPEAARLVGASVGMVRGWVIGYPNGAGPIIENQLGWVDDKLALSFVNLMELAFLAEFTRAGVRLPRLRAIMNEVRDLLERPHPFASKIKFRTDGRKIMAVIDLTRGRPKLYDLSARNYELHDVVAPSLVDGVVYDPMGRAAAWRPRRRIAPSVIVDPKREFGHPVVRHSGVPVEALVNSWRVERSVKSVAAWFEVSPREVRDALAFDKEMRKAA